MDSVKILKNGSIESQCIHFYIKENDWVSSAEISVIDEHTWDFNRLIVHRTMRGKGYASMLVDKVVEFCQENKLDLQCGINPYGDMDFKQLKDFYIRHGFQETEHEGLLIFKINS